MNIGFPDEQFTEKWKRTLLADLERRIQAVWGAVGNQCMPVGQDQREWTVFCYASRIMS